MKTESLSTDNTQNLVLIKIHLWVVFPVRILGVYTNEGWNSNSLALITKLFEPSVNFLKFHIDLRLFLNRISKQF